MNVFHLPKLAVPAIGLLLTACDDPSNKLNLDRMTALPVQCHVALAQHSGTQAVDMTIQRLQQRLQRNTKNTDLWEHLGMAYIDKAMISFDPGFYTLAEQSSLCLQQHKPESLAALLLQGRIAHHFHRFRKAEDIGQKLVARRGRWFDYGLLGDALMEQGKLTSAIDAYQQMMNQNPGPHSYNRAAYMRWLNGDIEGAVELLQLSLQAYAGQQNAHSAWTITRLAEYEFQQGLTSDSSQRLDRLLSWQPNYAPALLLLGQIKLSQGDSQQAVELLTRAQAINPLPQYLWGLIEALSATHHQDLKSAYRQQLFSSGATQDKRTFALYLATHEIEPALAVKLAKQELAQRQDVFTLDAYAWTLYVNGHRKEAWAYSQRALQHGTAQARLFFHAGIIAKANGQDQQAQQFFRQAKRLEHTLWPSEKLQLTRHL